MELLTLFDDCIGTCQYAVAIEAPYNNRGPQWAFGQCRRLMELLGRKRFTEKRNRLRGRKYGELLTPTPSRWRSYYSLRGDREALKKEALLLARGYTSMHIASTDEAEAVLIARWCAMQDIVAWGG